MAGKKRLISTEQIEASKERRRAWDRDRHAKHKEKRNAARRAAHAKNPEYLRQKESDRYKAQPQRKKKIDVCSRYGIKAYEALQSIDHCEACGDFISGKRKHIDHDHALPRPDAFRGILCGHCNVALGYLKEDENRILGLLTYLKSKGRQNMKTFNQTCAQGDIYIRRVDSLPANAVKVAAENGRVIVTHSETGHHHVMEAKGVTMYSLPDSIMDCLLVVDQPTALEHLREHDTHEPIMFDKGIYHVRRQQEYTPEGLRRVED